MRITIARIEGLPHVVAAPRKPLAVLSTRRVGWLQWVKAKLSGR